MSSKEEILLIDNIEIVNRICGMKVLLILAVLFVFTFIIIHIYVVIRLEPRRELQIISHRGASAYAPENTIASIEKALNLGAANIEIDVNKTRDNVLVVIHDRRINRTTEGKGYIRDMLWDEVKLLNAGSYFYKSKRRSMQTEKNSPPIEYIPKLETVLEIIKDHKCSLFIEVKKPRLNPNIGTLLAAAIYRYNLENSVIIISFDKEWLASFSGQNPEIETGTLHALPVNLYKVPEKQFISIHWINILLFPFLVTETQKRGYVVVAWTIDSPLLMKWLIHLGVDAITTNKPDVGLRVKSLISGR